MNVLYLHCHDAGRMISPYGYALSTPALARLAGQATLFRHCFCGGPTCSPSRAALLTGQWAHQTGMLGLAHRGFSLRYPERHLANYLKLHGFHTVLSGVQHEFAHGQPLPYQEVLPIPPSPDFSHPGSAMRQKDREVAGQAVRFLHRHPREQPFFLSCGFCLPHREYPPLHSSSDPDSLLPPPPLPNTPTIREDWARYALAVQSMDECAGQVLTALEETGLDQTTLVLFTTDHGIAFPHCKCSLTDHGTGVALLLRYPGNPAAGKKLEPLVSHLDLFPTLCDLLELPPPDWLEGTSLRPLLEGRSDRVRNFVHSEVTFHASYEPQRMVRNERFLYIRRFSENTRPVLPNCDDSPSKTELLLDSGVWEVAQPDVALHDLLLDPFAFRNIAGDSRYARVQATLEAECLSWMRRTDDPLLQGAVLPPVGAKVNPRHQISPGEPVETQE